MKTHKIFLWTLLGGFVFSFSANATTLPGAATTPPPIDEPAEFALFEEVPIVFSASRIEEPIIQAPAAISIITGDDLEHWGTVDLPDAFRFVPGMDVMAVDGRSWGVTARGFNERYARRMLVLVDGMSVYTPWFSGVHWTQIPLIVEDIDKIEIVRGPNDTLYGFNAFNGVINITTKDPKDTYGFYGKYIYGSFGRDVFVGRYGDSIDLGGLGDIDFRTTYSFHQAQGYGDNQGKEFEDKRFANIVTSRLRYEITDKLNAEFLFGLNYGPQSQSGLTAGDTTYRFTNDFVSYLGRLNYQISDNHEATLQFYHWRNVKRAKFLDVGNIDTRSADERQYDIEFQDRFTLFDGKSETVIGGNYRHNAIDSLLIRRKDPYTRNQIQTTRDNLFSVFWNQKFNLIEGKRFIHKLSLIGGIRLEGSQLIPDLEWAPRVSLMYAPFEDHYLRATYARAFRLPTFLERYSMSVTPANTGLQARFLGNPDLKREEVNSYELGYSGLFFDKKLSVDVDTYLAKYSSLAQIVSINPAMVFIPPIPPALTPTVSTPQNSIRAQAYGIELEGSVQLTPWMKVFSNYTYEYITDTNDSPISKPFEGATPKNKANLGVYLEFDRDSIEKMPFLDGFSMTFNMNYRDAYHFYDESGFGVARHRIKENIRFDFRVAKSLFNDSVELAFIGQNLTENKHFEAGFVQVPRILYMTVTLKSWPWEFWKKKEERTSGFIQEFQERRKNQTGT